MKRSVLVITLLFATLAWSQASPTPALSSHVTNELFAGYTYLRTDYTGSLSSANGFTAAYTHFFTTRVGLTGMLEGEFGGVHFRNYGLTIGPRVNFSRGRFQPFVHVLGGVIHSSIGSGSISDSKSAFGLQAGGGVNLQSGSRRVGWRLIEFDWERQFHTFSTSHGSDRARISTGLNLQF